MESKTQFTIKYFGQTCYLKIWLGTIMYEDKLLPRGEISFHQCNFENYEELIRMIERDDHIEGFLSRDLRIYSLDSDLFVSFVKYMGISGNVLFKRTIDKRMAIDIIRAIL